MASETAQNSFLGEFFHQRWRILLRVYYENFWSCMCTHCKHEWPPGVKISHMWCSTAKGVTLQKLSASHFFTIISVDASPCPLLIFLLCSIRLMPTFNRQKAILIKDLFQETNNKTTNNAANIDHYHKTHYSFCKVPPLSMYCITYVADANSLTYQPLTSLIVANALCSCVSPVRTPSSCDCIAVFRRASTDAWCET